MEHRNGWRRRWALIALLGMSLAQAAPAAQDDDLKLVEAGSALAGRLAAVGRVYSGYGPSLSMASGFLVSACHVLTAGHVLAKNGESVRLGSEVRFVPGSNQGRSVLPLALNGRVVAASQEFIMQPAPTGFSQERIPNDWALIELDQPVTGIEPIRLLYPEAEPAPGTAYAVVGYPLGQRQQGLFAQEHCRNASRPHGGNALQGILVTDCAVRQGMSGGPILIDDSRQPIAAGIVAERLTIGEKVLTIGVPVAAFAEKIDIAMRESDICAIGSPYVWPTAR
ncbi:MAG: serine protease [Proteobacteria bacterium]|nr:serine protease [Pseudomonadota bacterium]